MLTSNSIMPLESRGSVIKHAIPGAERTATLTKSLGHENSHFTSFTLLVKVTHIPAFHLSSTPAIARNPSTETAFCELTVTPTAAHQHGLIQCVFPISSVLTRCHPVPASPLLQREHNTLLVSFDILDDFSGSDRGSHPPVPKLWALLSPAHPRPTLCALIRPQL